MVTYIAGAVTWALSRMLGVDRNEPVAHRELQHAHWDPGTHQWFVHEDEPEVVVSRAA